MIQLVTWNTINYNYGNPKFGKSFDGTHFTARQNGIYSFYVTVNQTRGDRGYVYLYQGDSIVAQNSSYGDYSHTLVLQATIKLEKGNKVHVRLDGYLNEAGFLIRDLLLLLKCITLKTFTAK